MNLGAAVVSCSFLVLSITNLSDAANAAEIEQLGKACNATQGDIAVMQQYLAPRTKTGKCALLCILTRFYPAFDSNGKYDRKQVEKSLLAAWYEMPPADMPVIARHCEKMLKDEPVSNYKTCQIGYNVMECINNKSWMLGWFDK